MDGKIILQEDVYAEIAPSGMVIISQRYDGPLGQDRFREIDLSPIGAQKLLDLLANGQAVEQSVQRTATPHEHLQAEFDYICVGCGDLVKRRR